MFTPTIQELTSLAMNGWGERASRHKKSTETVNYSPCSHFAIEWIIDPMRAKLTTRFEFNRSSILQLESSELIGSEANSPFCLSVLVIDLRGFGFWWAMAGIFEYFVVCGIGPEIRTLDGQRGYHGTGIMYLASLLDQYPPPNHTLYPPPPPQLSTVSISLIFPIFFEKCF